MAVDGGGNLYIADAGNQRVRKISPSGIITTVAGNGISDGYSGDGGPATSAQLNYPSSVAVDSGGNLYIADVVKQPDPQSLPIRNDHHVVAQAGWPGSGCRQSR